MFHSQFSRKLLINEALEHLCEKFILELNCIARMINRVFLHTTYICVVCRNTLFLLIQFFEF